ncbi:MAG: tripartite tricarboxylate transporter substrate binding protein [candidate division NC10 bacterium]|nr:tripartite tricarboxylate transporter substrate binding protein [candidate division NC10 bacterium]
MIMRKVLLGIMFVAVLGMGLSHIARAMAAAQDKAGGAAKTEAIDFPSRPVRLVVPFPPGGGSDVMARLLSRGLTNKRGYVVAIDNRGGAGGIIGSEVVAKALPDGYTLVLANNTTHVMAVALRRKPPYDPLRDFTPISMITEAPMVLATSKTLPPRTIAELISYAKSKPGELNWATGGRATQTHLAMEVFLANAGIKAAHIPYKGTGPGFTALMSGEAQVMFVNISAALPYVQSGTIRALGVMGAKRSALQPDIPTIGESGVRGFDTNMWFGVLGPAKLPAAIVRKLHEDIVAAIRDDEIKQLLTRQGAEAIGSTAEEFAASIKRELDQLRPIVEKLGLHEE